MAPVVDVGELSASLRAWVDARRGPKLLVATQTKVIEVAVDGRGDCVPLTPVIELRPPEGWLWRVAAALTNPVATAFAARLGAGTALAIERRRERLSGAAFRHRVRGTEPGPAGNGCFGGIDHPLQRASPGGAR